MHGEGTSARRWGWWCEGCTAEEERGRAAVYSILVVTTPNKRCGVWPSQRLNGAYPSWVQERRLQPLRLQKCSHSAAQPSSAEYPCTSTMLCCPPHHQRLLSISVEVRRRMSVR